MKSWLVHFQRLVASVKLYRQVRKISYKASQSGTVVFNPVGCFLSDVDCEFYLAFLLARAGFHVKILMDDHTLEHWDYIQREEADDDYRRHHSLRFKSRLKMYGWLSEKIFAHRNIEVIQYSTILKALPQKVDLDDKDRGHAVSSVLRYFQVGEFRVNDPAHQAYYKVSLKNCEISKRVGFYVDQHISPDLFVTSHGIYSTWGPCYDTLRAKGYKCLVYAAAWYLPQRLHIIDTIVQTMTDASNWIEFRKRDMTEEQRRTVDHYFEERFKGNAIDTALHFKGVDRTTKFFVKRGRCTFGLFPNVIWDADIVERNTFFDGAVDWIVATIRYIQGGPDRLVLRFHPAEVTIMPFSKKLETVIRDKVPDLDDIANVTVISSDRKIDVYQLARDCIDVGLVYEGMLPLELTYLGIPVIAAGRGRWFGAGIAFEPSSREKYFELLASPDTIRAEFRRGKHRENVYQFAYWYLYESTYLMPLFKARSWLEVNYQQTARELDPATNPELLRTIQTVENYVAG